MGITTSRIIKHHRPPYVGLINKIRQLFVLCLLFVLLLFQQDSGGLQQKYCHAQSSATTLRATTQTHLLITAKLLFHDFLQFLSCLLTVLRSLSLSCLDFTHRPAHKNNKVEDITRSSSIKAPVDVLLPRFPFLQQFALRLCTGFVDRSLKALGLFLEVQQDDQCNC